MTGTLKRSPATCMELGALKAYDQSNELDDRIKKRPGHRDRGARGCGAMQLVREAR